MLSINKTVKITSVITNKITLNYTIGSRDIMRIKINNLEVWRLSCWHVSKFNSLFTSSCITNLTIFFKNTQLISHQKYPRFQKTADNNFSTIKYDLDSSIEKKSLISASEPGMVSDGSAFRQLWGHNVTVTDPLAGPPEVLPFLHEHVLVVLKTAN